jgi:hypothetical protein
MNISARETNQKIRNAIKLAGLKINLDGLVNRIKLQIIQEIQNEEDKLIWEFLNQK